MSTNIYNATTDKLKDIGSGGSGDPEALEAIENTITSSSSKEEEGAITATKAHSEGDYFNLGGVFVKAIDDIAVGETLIENTNYEVTNVSNELTSMKSSFQDGCDTIVQAVTAMGQTPASNSPSDIATAIGNIETGDETHGAVTLADFNNMTDAQLLALNEGTNSYGDPISVDEETTKTIVTEDNKNIFTLTHKHIYFCNIVREIKPLLHIVSWAEGTDAQILAMIEAADAGDIDLTEYWDVGDTRNVSLSAMNATGVGESHVAQTVQMVLVAKDTGTQSSANPCYNYQYVTATSGRTYPSFIVQQKNTLANGLSRERGYMNSSGTNAGGWNGCARRTWCNNVYKAALPSSLVDIFKQVKVKAMNNGNQSGAALVESSDYFFLPAEKEVFGSATYSNTTEANALSQWPYYNTSANRKKYIGSSSSDDLWWERSPYSGNSAGFCRVHSDGSAKYDYAATSIGLAPAGCI